MSVVDSCHLDGVVGVGSADAQIMCVGIAPGRSEWMDTKKPFTGPSGKLLDGLLKLVNRHRDDGSIYLTNLLCWWKDAPTLEDIAPCMPRFIKEVKRVKPRIIFALGKIVSEILLPQYTFGKMQGGAFWHEGFNCWIISTYHPSAYFDRGGNFAEIHDGVRDFRKIPIYLKADKDFGHVDYKVAQGLDEINEYFRHIALHTDEVAIDVETYYDGSGMLSMALACSHGTYHIPREFIYGPDYSILVDSNTQWTYHNGQFDRGQNKKWHGVDLPIREDTMLISYTLDERGGGNTEADSGGNERAVGVHGLKHLAMEYCGAEFYSDGVKGRIDQLTPEKLALYNSSDAEYTYRLIKYLKPIQIEDGVREVYENILIPAANVFSEIHERGAYIDLKALKGLAKEWIPRWLEREKSLLQNAHELGWHNEEINTNSPKQLSKFIYDILHAPTIGTGKMERSTAKPIVEKMVADYPTHPASIWLGGLLEWRGLDRDINTWIRELETARDKNGFIHPEGLLHGTRNGRAAYHNPPVQTVPKLRTVGADRARIRRIFAAAPPSDLGTGPRMLMESDLRQAELWVTYFVTGDNTMYEDLATCNSCHRLTSLVNGEMVTDDGLVICSNGKPHKSDFHAQGATGIWGVTKEDCTSEFDWEYIRDSYKRIVYGITYGAGAGTLAEGKKLTGAGGANYRFIETVGQAQKAIDDYLGRYHVFHAWREEEKRIVGTEGEQISRTGRKRRYYMIQSYSTLNQAINTPISSFSHDFILMDMIELHYLLREFDAYINFEIHDSLVIDFPQKYIKEVAQLVTHIMTKPRFGSPCGIPIDIKVGKNWFDVQNLSDVIKELELAA